MNIELIEDNHNAVFSELISGLKRHRTEHMGPEEPLPLGLTIKDTQGKVIGGIGGRTIYRNWLIEVLWIDDSLRGQGYGRKLIEQAEELAKQRGCVVAQLDTLEFQAADFYQKMGFEVVGTVPAFEGSPARYFMLKHF
ncbi:GNAT family N-acetyltransferase [Shewanella sp. WXL01]|uniref:GNAT family N-acetyltransferase n=1 Tax=Shewanella sp. WXL01 TaxID=2709721 RepID=UPI0014384D5F|nr:GNAT family N-acetyltransferase [Shewanella sp. WXL01]NKF49387.1 GNAT family N-acetyltransferase [Shewanella sp. WXL01]